MPDTLDNYSVQTLHSDSDLVLSKVVVGSLDNNVFFITCAQTGESVMLDAADEHELLLKLCEQTKTRLVLETHGHWDHIGALTEVRDAGYDVGVGAGDTYRLPGYDFILEHDTQIEVGELKLDLIATPGHTEGSICFKVVDKPFLFTGDTLFAGGPGRTDLPGGNFNTVLESISERLFKFDKDTICFPGHGDVTTIGAEQADFQAWVDRGW